MSNYVDLLTHRNVQVFLALIKYTEGAGYQTLFLGSSWGSQRKTEIAGTR